MPQFRFTSPDGKRSFNVTGPEGSTKEQAFEVFKSQNPQLFQAPTPEQPKAQEMGLGEMASQAVQNIPSSAARFASDIGTAVMHPLDTVGGLASTAVGLAEKAGEAITGTDGGQDEHKQRADALISHYTNRYGGVENLKRTIAADPVGFLADVATIVTPTGGALKLGGASMTGKAAGIGSKVAAAGETIAKAGAAVEPLNIGLQATSAAAKAAIPSRLAEKLYTSAAKFSTTYTPDKRIEMARTALDKEILPNAIGLDKLYDDINALNTRISGMVDEATAKGNRISLSDIAKGFDELREKARLSGQPETAIRQVNKVQEQFFKANKDIGREFFTPSQAQELKQTIYKQLQNAYQSTAERPFSVKAQKLIAKNARMELEAIIPEIKALNKEEGAMIELHRAIERAANRITNRDLVGLGAPMKTAGGAAAAGGPGAAAGVALGILDLPQVKARIAIAVDKLKQKGITIHPTSTANRLNLLAPIRAKDQEENK